MDGVGPVWGPVWGSCVCLVMLASNPKPQQLTGLPLPTLPLETRLLVVGFCRCIDSDAISAMRALCEYEAAGDSEEYCRYVWGESVDGQKRGGKC